ncbi:hypothetical protein FHT44_004992 [Mycolicibacterium sp. BK634]|uniref:hypothetical protein n=1 Tax=Mycolicibacterium sp. BK634 TaxID=2587099 RepID=UPI0017BDA88D|nr:hypothetical protein [Mycolicibacterium sp. BK634]MBB3752480.1 hypothetical protein [Mycolicibacterium sp. BK634]
MQQQLKITLYSANDQIRSAVRAFKSNVCQVLEITDSSKMPRVDLNEEQQPGTIGRLNLPDRVDAVISCSALNSKTEGLAASLGLKQNRNDVYAVVLPEALDWLKNKLDRHGELVLVGADQAK